MGIVIYACIRYFRLIQFMCLTLGIKKYIMKEVLRLKIISFLFLGIFLACLVSCNNRTTVDKILKNENSVKGEMLDEMTQFDGAYIIGDNFYYEYTLSILFPYCTAEKSRQPLFSAISERLFSDNLNESINVTPIFKTIGDLGYNLIFKYKCEGGIDLTEVKYNYTAGDFYYINQSREWDTSVDLFLEMQQTLTDDLILDMIQ